MFPIKKQKSEEDILPSQRHLFAMPRDLVYLNASYMTPITRQGEAVLHAAATARRTPWAVQPSDFFTQSEQVRASAARIYGAAANDIALIPSVSYAAATVARNLPALQGRQILVLDQEFPSNRYPWDRAAREKGGQVHALTGPADQDWTAAIIDHLDKYADQVALVAIPAVHWSSGRTLDVVTIGKAARACGTLLFLDLTQSLGAMPFDVGQVQPDYAAATSYKWLFGPYGLTYFYVAPQHQSGLPLEENWIAREGAENFAGLTRYTNAYQPGARRFDMGERSNFLTLPLAQVGLDLVLEWGVPRIARSLRIITGRLADLFAEAEFMPIAPTQRVDHFLSVKPTAETASNWVTRLKENNILTSARGEWLRLSPHLWIGDSDYELLCARLCD